MNWVQISISLLGGLGIFLYGMYIASEGLRKSASHRLRSFLNRVTKNQVYGAGAGTILAAVLQSSSAATVMVVGFVNAGLMSLRRAMGVMLGSAVGTTVTVQLIAFRITDYALLFVALGVLLFLVSTSPQVKFAGSILLGFGFVFFGMGLMTDAMQPVQSNAAFMNYLLLITENPLLTVLVATLFTAIIQNSAATIALAMTLAASGSLTLEAAVAIVYGANLGTVVTAMISSLSASRDAQRAALAHGIFKWIGVLFFLPLTPFFVSLLPYLGGDVERQIANAHTVFNVVNLFILLPFCNRFADWMIKLLPEKALPPQHVKYLEQEVVEFPTVALMQARKELEHMAGIIRQDMFHSFIDMLRDERARHKVMEEEKTIDHLYRAIYHHLQRILEQDLSDRESEEGLKLLYLNNDLERMANVMKQLARSLGKLKRVNKSFSEWEIEQIEQLYREVFDSYDQALRSFQNHNKEAALKVIQRNPKIMRMERELRYRHFYDGAGPSSTVSVVFSDLINGLLRVHQHSVNISQTVIGMV